MKMKDSKNIALIYTREQYNLLLNSTTFHDSIERNFTKFSVKTPSGKLTLSFIKITSYAYIVLLNKQTNNKEYIYFFSIKYTHLSPKAHGVNVIACWKVRWRKKYLSIKIFANFIMLELTVWEFLLLQTNRFCARVKCNKYFHTNLYLRNWTKFSFCPMKSLMPESLFSN